MALHCDIFLLAQKNTKKGNMGATPLVKDITVEFYSQFWVKLPDCKFSTIMKL